MTFGLIALVMTGGSLVYKNKIEQQYFLAAEQQKVQKIRQQRLSNEAQTRLIQQQLVQQAAQNQFAIQDDGQIYTTQDQAQAAVATLGAQQQTQVSTPTRTITLTPVRRSRAS